MNDHEREMLNLVIFLSEHRIQKDMGEYMDMNGKTMEAVFGQVSKIDAVVIAMFTLSMHLLSMFDNPESGSIGTELVKERVDGMFERISIVGPAAMKLYRENQVSKMTDAEMSVRLQEILGDDYNE
jgi:hypothetical protein